MNWPFRKFVDDAKWSIEFWIFDKSGGFFNKPDKPVYHYSLGFLTFFGHIMERRNYTLALLFKPDIFFIIPEILWNLFSLSFFILKSLIYFNIVRHFCREDSISLNLEMYSSVSLGFVIPLIINIRLNMRSLRERIIWNIS